MISPALQDATGARLGDRITLNLAAGATGQLTVVGVAQEPRGKTPREAWTLPAALASVADQQPQDFLVDTTTPLTWPDVLRLNDQGYVVTSRPVVLDPPPRDQVPYFQQQTGPSAEAVATGVIAVGMVLLEIVLLAGPALAVGARRDQARLALLGAVGGDRRHLRLAVLAQGLVLGAAAAVGGVSLGVGVAAAVRPLLVSRFDAVLYSFDVRPLELLAVGAVGALTALLASLVPAQVAARLDIVAALTGRRQPVSKPWRTPTVGAVLVGIGVATALLGASDKRASVIFGGSAIAEIGLVLATPTLIAVAARLGSACR